MGAADIWHSFASTAGPWAVSALWQGAALALGLALFMRLMPRISARDRFRAWSAGFAALAALPLLPGALSLLHSALNGDGLAAVPAAGAAHPWLNLDFRWSVAIAAVWLIASLARAIDLGIHAARLRRLWKRAVPVTPFIASGAAAGFAALSGKPIEICATRDLDRPSVIGFFAPRILIPAWLLERLTAAELEQVVLHEAEHLGRRDDWINLAQKLCLMLFPLNPFLIWMDRRLCREREMACDEGVVLRTQAPRAYAACLASLAEHGLRRNLAGGRAEALSLGVLNIGARRRPEVAIRIHRILRGGCSLHPLAARVLLGMVGCGLALTSFEMARSPRLVAFSQRPAARQIANTTLRPQLPAPESASTNSLRGLQTHEMLASTSRPVSTAFGRSRAISRMRRPISRSAAALQEASSTSAVAEFAGDRAGNDLQSSNAIAAASPESMQAARRVNAAGAYGARNLNAIPANATARAEIWSAGREVAMVAGAVRQQVIVLTTWEQLENTGWAAEPANRPISRPISTLCVVRKYSVSCLAFYADSPMTSNSFWPDRSMKQSQARAALTTIPLALISPAAPVQSGWFVIQL